MQAKRIVYLVNKHGVYLNIFRHTLHQFYLRIWNWKLRAFQAESSNTPRCGIAFYIKTQHFAPCIIHLKQLPASTLCTINWQRISFFVCIILLIALARPTKA